MTNTDVIKKLVGNIKAQGESNADALALENLKQMCNVVKELLFEIDMALCERPFAKEASVLKNQSYAKQFLNEIGYRKD